jgi:hypothetical protein
MDRMELKRQVEAVYKRLIEAEILMENIASQTELEGAAEMVARITKVHADMFAFRGDLYQNSVIPGWREPVDVV